MISTLDKYGEQQRPQTLCRRRSRDLANVAVPGSKSLLKAPMSKMPPLDVHEGVAGKARKVSLREIWARRLPFHEMWGNRLGTNPERV